MALFKQKTWNILSVLDIHANTAKPQKNTLLPLVVSVVYMWCINELLAKALSFPDPYWSQQLHEEQAVRFESRERPTDAAELRMLHCPSYHDKSHITWPLLSGQDRRGRTYKSLRVVRVMYSINNNTDTVLQT